MSSGQDSAIYVRSLRRTYSNSKKMLRRSRDETVALDNVDLDVPAGEVHGLLGPNGAGKSTLCKILATVLVPTSGTARVLGHDVVRKKAAVRSRIAMVLGGERGLYYQLTGLQNLRFWAALYGLSRVEADRRASELLERVGLTRGNDRVDTYSRGMKQRLHLARGLISDPEVILLDEPTTGMDPIATKDFRTLVREEKQGRTILLTTHDMVEAEALCDRVSVINDGRILASESPPTLASWITRFERIDVGPVDDSLAEKIRRSDGVGRIVATADGLRIETVAAGAAAAVLQLLLDNGHTDVRTSMPSLEEVYVHLLAGEKGSRP